MLIMYQVMEMILMMKATVTKWHWLHAIVNNCLSQKWTVSPLSPLSRNLGWCQYKRQSNVGSLPCLNNGPALGTRWVNVVATEEDEMSRTEKKEGSREEWRKEGRMVEGLEPQPMLDQDHVQLGRTTALGGLNIGNSRSAPLSAATCPVSQRRAANNQWSYSERVSVPTLENADRRGASSFLAENKLNSSVPRGVCVQK